MRYLGALFVVFWSGSTLVAAEGVSIKVVKDESLTVIEFRSGEKLVTRYLCGTAVAKPYFWPMLAPGEIPVTRAWPMQKGEQGETTDHVHQKSAWFCHGDVVPEGLEIKSKIKGVEGIDFWSENTGHGKIVTTNVGEPKIDKNHGSIVTTNEWRTAEGVVILKEERTIHFTDLGYARLFTLDIDLMATDYPIIFGDTKEGSMAVRVSDKIAVKPGGGNYRNAEGASGESAVWGKKSLWCDYVGKIDGKEAGIAVFDDPSNPHPSCWHARGYGLMAANPFGRAKSGFSDQKGKNDLVKLAKGEHIKLRYGIALHAGNTETGRVADAFEVFKKKS